jgi:hypothetical protein
MSSVSDGHIVSGWSGTRGASAPPPLPSSDVLTPLACVTLLKPVLPEIVPEVQIGDSHTGLYKNSYKSAQTMEVGDKPQEQQPWQQPLTFWRGCSELAP